MIRVSLIKELLDRDVKSIYVLCRGNSDRLSRLPSDNRIHIITCNIGEYETLSEK